MTEYALNLALFSCATSAAKVLYVLPSQKGSVDTLHQFPAVLGYTGITAVVVGNGELRIGKGSLFLRGALDKSTKYQQLRGLSPNMMIVDGLDRMGRNPQFFVKQWERTVAPRETIIMGNTQGYSRGMYRLWRNSDRRQWHVKCEGCGSWQTLRPGNLVQKWNADRTVDVWNHTADGKIFFSCADCGKPLNRQGKGEWVAEKPDRDVAGFLLSQAVNPEFDIYLLAGGLSPGVHSNERRWSLNGLWGLPYTTTPRAFDRFVLGRRDRMMFPYTVRRPRRRLIPRQNGRRRTKKQDAFFIPSGFDNQPRTFPATRPMPQEATDILETGDMIVTSKRLNHGGSNE